jgi:parallel beta-helix repeat protein
MTTWYFDSVNGLDANAGTSEGAAKASYDAFRVAGLGTNSDTYLFKRGTTQVITTANIGFRSGLSTTNRTIVGAYGTASVPYATFKPVASGTPASDFIINCSGLSNIDISDLYFDGLNQVSYSMYILASGATANSGHRIRRCYFTNMKYGGSGLVIGATATSTGATTDYVIEDCHFFDNRTHGLLINGAWGVTVRRCKFYGNGFNAAAGGHGLSCKARRTDASSGWTNTSGTIWQKTLAAYETDVYYVKTSVSGYQRLAKNVSTPTTPTLGEFGVSGGVLYINMNSASNPSSQSVVYAWGRCYNILVEDCESYENVWDQTAPDHEGHGFALDDFTDSSILRRNKSYNNEGAGFTINRGDNNTIENNIAYNNQLAAVAGSACWNSTIRHNTFYANNTGTGAHNGEIAFFTYAQNGVITNNILRGSRTYGIDVDTTCAGFSGSNNCVYGYGSVDRSGAYTGTVTVDPLLDSEHRATAATVKRGGTYLGGRDFFGKYHTNPPSIGAVSDHPTPGWAAAGRKAA